MGRPSSRCNKQAAEGTRVSGVSVATMHAPMESAGMPEDSSALRAACTVMEVKVSPSAMWRRREIPVREVIHSSLVSTILARSSLVTILDGAAYPVPTILIPFIAPPYWERRPPCF